MAATTVPINVPTRPNAVASYPVAAATLIPAGVLVALDASGDAVNASNTAGLRVVGRAEVSADNSAGSAGDINIEVRHGCFRYANSAGSALAQADTGKTAVVEDNQTVALAASHSVAAGRVVEVDAEGVWIDTLNAGRVPTVLALTSAQNATTAAVDDATAEALANALKANYNQLQVDVAAIRTALIAQGILA